MTNNNLQETSFYCNDSVTIRNVAQTYIDMVNEDKNVYKGDHVNGFLEHTPSDEKKPHASHKELLAYAHKHGGPSIKISHINPELGGGNRSDVKYKGSVKDVMKLHNHHHNDNYPHTYAGHKEMAQDYGLISHTHRHSYPGEHVKSSIEYTSASNKKGHASNKEILNYAHKHGGSSIKIDHVNHDTGGNSSDVQLKGDVKHIMKLHNHHHNDNYPHTEAGHKKMSKDYGLSSHTDSE